MKYSPSAKSLLDKFPPPTPLAINPLALPSASSNEPFHERAPLSPMIVEAVSPSDDPNRSAPPSPALPQPQVEYVHLNGLKYQIPVPQMPHSPMIGGSNMVDTEDSYEKYEGGIEQDIKLEEEVMRPLDEVVDDVAPVSTSLALAAASAAWSHDKGNGINGSVNGTVSKQVKPAALDIPSTNGSNVYPQNGKGKGPSLSTPSAAERAIIRSSGGSAAGSGRNSPVPARHTDSGFAEIVGEESPVSPKTVVPPKHQQQQGGRSNAGRSERG